MAYRFVYTQAVPNLLVALANMERVYTREQGRAPRAVLFDPREGISSENKLQGIVLDFQQLFSFFFKYYKAK